MTVTIRDATADDYGHIIALNNACVPAVNEVTLASLQHFASIAEILSAVTLGDDVVGFIICLRPGKAYSSDNYAWLSAKLKDFLYIDRVAFAQHAQGKGLGKHLYETVFARARELGCPVVCEVNTQPRNDQSLVFHTKLGFVEIGEASRPGGPTVAYLQRTFE